MTPLGQYYVRQAGGGGRGDSGICPVYSVLPFVQRGHGIGSFLRGLCATRTVEQCQVPRTRSVAHWRKIMTEIADNPAQTGHILSQHMSESTQKIIKKLRGGGGSRKRKRAYSLKPRKHKAKRARITKRKSSSSKRKAPSKTINRDILVIRISHYPIMSGDVEFVTSDFDIFAQKPIQTVILETHVIHYKPIATVDQNDLEFLIPGDTDSRDSHQSLPDHVCRRRVCNIRIRYFRAKAYTDGDPRNACRPL